jgi:hypothetical protein
VNLTIEYIKLERPVANGDSRLAYRVTIDGRSPALYFTRREVDLALATAFLRIDDVGTQTGPGHTRGRRRIAM